MAWTEFQGTWFDEPVFFSVLPQQGLGDPIHVLALNGTPTHHDNGHFRLSPRFFGTIRRVGYGVSHNSSL